MEKSRLWMKLLLRCDEGRARFGLLPHGGARSKYLTVVGQDAESYCSAVAADDRLSAV